MRRVELGQIVQFRFSLRQSQKSAFQFALVDFRRGVDGGNVAGSTAAASAACAMRTLANDVRSSGGAKRENAIDVHLRDFDGRVGAMSR